MKSIILAGACALAFTAVPAQAAVVIDVLQVGSNVEMVLSGTLDLTGLTQIAGGSRSQNGGVLAGERRINMGATGGFRGFSGVTMNDTAVFLPGAGNSGVGASQSSGDVFEVRGVAGRVFVPTAYVSGQSLSARNVYGGRTLAQLGLTLGSSVFTLTNSDTITINVGPQQAAVPEPASWAMLILGMGAVGATLRRRSTTTRISFAA